MKRLTAGILAVVMLLLQVSFAAEITLPDNLTNVKEEAFMGDSSITKVTMNDSLKAIGARAFQECENLESVTIPNSVTSIGADAFDPGTTICCESGSYAYDYAKANGLPVDVGYYAILDADVSQSNTVEVTADIDGSCTLRVELLDNAMEEILSSGTMTLAYAGKTTTYSMNLDNVPEFFVLRATLEDRYGNALCEPFISTNHTSGHSEFDQIVPENFPDSEVLHFGNGGFAVLQDDVITATGTASGSGFIVRASVPLTEGSLVYLPNCNDILKAKSVVDNGDGTYTVQRDETASLLDFYKHLRYTVTQDVAAIDGITSNRSASRGLLKANYTKDLERRTKKVEDGPFSATATIGAKLVCTYNLSELLRGAEYIDVETYIETDGSLDYEFSGAYEYNRLIEVFDIYFPTEVPGMYVDFDMTFPLHFKAEAAINYGTSFDGKVGFKYHSGSGYTPFRTGKFDPPRLTMKGVLSGSAGFRVGLGVSAAKLLNLGVGAEVGMRFTAEDTVADLQIIESLPKRHMCNMCFDLDIKKFIDLDISMSYWTVQEHKKELFSKKYPVYSQSIFDGYISMINSADSVHGGKIVMDEGECPNCEYMIEFETYDGAGKQVKDISTYIYSIKDDKRQYVSFLKSPSWTYLQPGAYEAEAEFGSTKIKHKFVVGDAPKKVRINPGTIPIDAAHFPDAAFREYVKQTFDSNKDGKLTVLEREDVRELYILDPEIVSLDGAEYFENVSVVNVGDDMDGPMGVRSLGPVLSPTLELIVLRHTAIESLDCSGCQALREIIFDGTLNSLTVKGCNALHYIGIYGSFLVRKLDLSGLSNLAEVYLPKHGLLKEINLSGCTALRVLEVRQNDLQSLDVSSCTALEWLGCEENKLTSLDVSKCTALEELYCEDNKLTSLDVTKCKELRNLSCGKNGYWGGNKWAEEELPWECIPDTNRITSLDLHDLTHLSYVYCSGMPLSYVNIRGCTSLEDLIAMSGDLANITVDATGANEYANLACYCTGGATIIGREP